MFSAHRHAVSGTTILDHIRTRVESGEMSATEALERYADASIQFDRGETGVADKSVDYDDDAPSEMDATVLWYLIADAGAKANRIPRVVREIFDRVLEDDDTWTMLAQVLFERYGPTILPDDDDINDYVYAAALVYQWDRVRMFLERGGGNIHIKNEFVLRRAIRQNNVDMMRYAIEQCADIYNRLVFEDAIRYDRPDVVRYLLEQGATPSKQAILTALTLPNKHILRLLVVAGVQLPRRSIHDFATESVMQALLFGDYVHTRRVGAQLQETHDHGAVGLIAVESITARELHAQLADHMVSDTTLRDWLEELWEDPTLDLPGPRCAMLPRRRHQAAAMQSL